MRRLIDHVVNAPSIDLRRRIPVGGIFGLGVLYASGYFLPLLGTTGAYLLPSHNLLRVVIAPSFIAVAAVSAMIYCVCVVAKRWVNPRPATLGAVLGLTALLLIGLKGVLDAASYNWQEALPHGHDVQLALRTFKVAAFLCVFGIVWAIRSSLHHLHRVLSSLGFAFGVLAIARVFALWSAPASPPDLPAAAAESIGQVGNTKTWPADTTGAAARSRRVVWVIFDETDFLRLFPPSGAAAPGVAAASEVPNFSRLAQASVFATNANSPASATLYSIPALLTGVSIGGDGVRIDKSAGLSVEDRAGNLLPFGDATSIFGALAAGGRSASVLGFYHPYCKLFGLTRCDSFAYPDMVGLDAALWANVPEGLSNALQPDYWESITRQTLSLLPEYLARDDSLTFVHLNFPHLPAPYADAMLHLPRSSNPLTEYSRNLQLADRVLGSIVSGLQDQMSRHELLLVVSTDHWLRNRAYQPGKPESSRPVPFMVWKVGDTVGFKLTQPLSTVHTASMIVEYLNGRLSSQEDIAGWWAKQPVEPTLIAPKT
jgi:hypothetical protein